MKKNKQKIFNDPIYGFIRSESDLVESLIEHRYFQRLRRIRQLGLTHLVYPGALHTRFHHAIGALHLMQRAIESMRSKGLKISDAEAEASSIAILLHDIGHGPFSHALENSIVYGISHEQLSALFIDRLNGEFKGRLVLAQDIFRNRYHRKFFHQLVSSQLDVDRLDYLMRDSFYAGVPEGTINADRIIKMLNVRNDKLVIEAKGIYSIENFIVSRRLMYWQVYLHKAVISAEQLIIKVLKRAKQLASSQTPLFCTPALGRFLYNRFEMDDFIKDPAILDTFSELDDYDIFASIKVWQKHPDNVLSKLCRMLVNRDLYKIQLDSKPIPKATIDKLLRVFMKKEGLTAAESAYFVFSGSISNNAYSPHDDKINILFPDGSIVDIARASDQLNISALSGSVKKFFLCYPKYLQAVHRG